MAVKCQPARRKCRPDIVPAQAFVRAGLSCAAMVFNCGAMPSVHAPDLRFWRGGLPSVYARHCVFVVAFFSRYMPGSAVLSTRLASVHACCLSCAKQDGLRCLAFLFRRVEIAVCAFSRRCGGAGAGRRDVGAFHAPRFAFSVRHCGFVVAFFLGICPALRFCRSVLPSFTPAVCLAPNRTACDALRSCSAGRDRCSCVLATLRGAGSWTA